MSESGGDAVGACIGGGSETTRKPGAPDADGGLAKGRDSDGGLIKRRDSDGGLIKSSGSEGGAGGACCG